MVFTLTRHDAADLECRSAVGTWGPARSVVTSSPIEATGGNWAATATVADGGVEVGRGSWPTG